MPIGFAVFFHNSRPARSPGLYLEDLFVKPEVRGKGYGAPCSFTWQIARDAAVADGMGGARLERTAIQFYKKIGAQPSMSGKFFA